MDLHSSFVNGVINTTMYPNPHETRASDNDMQHYVVKKELMLVMIELMESGGERAAYSIKAQ